MGTTYNGRTRLRRRSGGFSIIELMIVVSIIGILAAVAIPAFDELIRNNRRTVVVNELLSNVMLARAEAAKRGQPVSVCGNTSGGGISCTGAATWDYGWMVFLDPDGDGAIAATSDVLRQYVNDYADLKIRSDTDGLTAGHVVLRPFNQSSTKTNLLVCDKRGSAKARVVCVAGNGRSRASETTCDTGAALTCP